jgi:hypothetical protein
MTRVDTEIQRHLGGWEGFVCGPYSAHSHCDYRLRQRSNDDLFGRVGDHVWGVPGRPLSAAGPILTDGQVRHRSVIFANRESRLSRRQLASELAISKALPRPGAACREFGPRRQSRASARGGGQIRSDLNASDRAHMSSLLALAPIYER